MPGPRTIIAKRGWDARRAADRTQIRQYLDEQKQANYWVSTVLARHLLDIIDALATLYEVEDL